MPGREKLIDPLVNLEHDVELEVIQLDEMVQAFFAEKGPLPLKEEGH